MTSQTAGSDQATLQHIPDLAYRCYLPVLAGFGVPALYRTRSSTPLISSIHKTDRIRRWEFNPGVAGSGLQGSANSPSSTPKLIKPKLNGADRIRTDDPHVANVMLSQLSYCPISI